MFQLCKVSLLYSANKVRGLYSRGRCACVVVFELWGSLALSWNRAAVIKCKERANNGDCNCHDDDDDYDDDDRNLYDF